MHSRMHVPFFIGMTEKPNDLVERLRKRLEREQRARQEAERIAESAGAELYALNQMKSQFISIVSHELRTPLTAIVGFAQYLNRSELAREPRAQEAIAALERNALRLQSLVDEILTTSLFQHFDTNVQLRRVHFADLVNRVLEQLDTGKLEVRMDVGADLVVDSDPDLLAQILRNLVHNAVKFSPDGGLCVIGASADGSVLSFWVQDEGIGIAPSQIEHVFEPFWQADSSFTRRFAGVGLGLHVARRICQILGGDIVAASEPGKGSRFTATLRIGSAGRAGMEAG